MPSLVAALKGVSAIRDIINLFIDAWLTSESGSINDSASSDKHDREIYTIALKMSVNDETRKRAARKLYDLTHGVRDRKDAAKAAR